jgi:thiamine-phosphate pyrophosphorylase
VKNRGISYRAVVHLCRLFRLCRPATLKMERYNWGKAMLRNMTPAVGRALEAAQNLARAWGAAVVEPGHLLHALLLEEEGRASVLFAEAGLDRAAYQASLPSIPLSPSTEPLPLDDRTDEALTQARELAVELSGERTVASESLVLALLRADAALGPSLAVFGLRPEAVEAAILAQRLPPLRLDEPLHLPELTERQDTARILDACANRAREGLRVVEDYCRFVLDDALLSRLCKELRHDLNAALRDESAEELLSAREAQLDVGATIKTEAEQSRSTLVEVVQANLKRVQEALRSLEEYGKLRGPDLWARLEQLRYRAYTLERSVVLGGPARQRLRQARLYVLLSAAQCKYSLQRTIEEAAAGGAAVIQLREKHLTDRDLLERARGVRRWTRQAGVLFIVNDRPDIARLVEADGVHLGQEDLSVRDAARILGPDALIGVSTHSLEQVRQAVLDGASYLGVGPVFPSATKDFAAFPGLAFVREALAETSLPAFAIGGVNLATLPQAAAAGVRCIAVSHAIAQAEDPRAVAVALLQGLP